MFCLQLEAIFVIHLFFCIVPHSTVSISLGTFNIWNVMFNWKTRVVHIAGLIREKDIDIASFQEIRLTKQKDSNIHSSQLDEFRTLLPEYKWSLAVPAGQVKKPKNAYWKEWNREGLAILSRKQILSYKVVNLTRPGSPDQNPRIALHVRLRVGPKADDSVNVIVVHFSYDKQQQCQNAVDVMDFVSSNQLQNVIVVGDFNVYPDFPAPTDLFTSKRQSVCAKGRQSRFSTAMGTFKDVWTSSGHSSSNGLTFSNMPTPGLQSRPDRILVSRQISVVDTATTGDGVDYRNYFYTSVIISRARSVVQTSIDSLIGKTGYSCLHDCGPHGSCRCGVCIKGGNQLNCETPNCQECDGLDFVLFLTILIPFVVLGLTAMFSIVKILLVSARFSQEDILTILGYRCCLFNQQLFRFQLVPRRYRNRLSRLFSLCQIPPLLLFIVSLVGESVLLIVFYYMFSSSIDLVFSVLPEEMFPSDHLFLYAKLDL